MAIANKGPSKELGIFLSDRHYLVIEELSSHDISELSRSLEEVFLNSDFKSNQGVRQVLLMGLPELMQDLVNEIQFPRDTLVPVYTNVFRLWSELKLYWFTVKWRNRPLD